MHSIRVTLLVNLGQHEQSHLPERFGDAVQAPIEAALGQGGDVAVAGEEVERGLLIAGEQLGRDDGDGHDLGGAKSCLGIVSMAQGVEELLEKAVDGDNLFWHSRLSGEFGVGNRTLSGGY